MTDTPSPAILQKTSDRPDLLIFEVTSEIHTADVERMARTVETAIEKYELIDILLVFRTFEGVTLGAAMDGKAMKVSLRSNAHVRRYGVVGAPKLAEAMINLFDPLTPIDARTFETGQIDLAHAWMNGWEAGARPGSPN